MPEDLTLVASPARRREPVRLRTFAAGIMRGVGSVLLVVAGLFVAWATFDGGLPGLGYLLFFAGFVFVPWIVNGVILVGWAGPLERAEATPRLPRALALLQQAIGNGIFLLPLAGFDGGWGVAAWTLLAAATVANAVGAVAVATASPAPGAPRTGSAWRAWALVAVFTALWLAGGGPDALAPRPAAG
ncbi:MAG: hypothetical protein M3279_00140 [Actinomycetota bacterium]|nr:hypothetical protein [Actinomycetota bacterium]